MTISTILVVLGILLMILGAGTVVVRMFGRRSSNINTLSASISIFPSGQSVVEMSPYANVGDLRMMKIATLYVAKIGYVLDSGDPEVRDMFRTLLSHVAGENEPTSGEQFVERLAAVSNGLQLQWAEPSATGSGELFAVKLYEAVDSDHVINELPFRGLAANVPISAILLLDEAASRISEPMNLYAFERSLFYLVQEMYRLTRFDIASLKHLNRSIRDGYETVGQLTESN